MKRTPEVIYDEWLVLRSQDGDADALRILAGRWHGRLLRHAARLTNDADGAAEAAQEAWLAIVRGLRRLDDPARFPAWSLRIVSFKCADWIRARSRDRERWSGSQGIETTPSAPAEDLTQHDDDLARLRAALRTLSADHRAALSLHYLEGMSVDDIAHALNIPPGTVKSRLHHARARLKETLERTAP